MLEDDNTASGTFELHGPKNYSTAEIAALVDREIIKHRRHINIPKRIYKPIANLLNKLLWWPIMSADEVEREFIDQKIDPKAKTFKDLGIEPAEISNLTFHYLVSGPNLIQRTRLNMDVVSHSKDTGVRLSTIYRRLRNERRERKRSTYMLLTINDRMRASGVYYCAICI